MIECETCNERYSKLEEHTSEDKCERCGGMQLKCTPHNDLHCLLHGSIVYHNFCNAFTPLERLQVFSEACTTLGNYFCIFCGTKTSDAWNDRCAHGLLDTARMQWIPVCLPVGTPIKFLESSNPISLPASNGNDSNNKFSAVARKIENPLKSSEVEKRGWKK